VVGCSSGAIVAGLYAAGLSPKAIRDFLLATHFHLSVFEWTIPLRGFAMTFNLPGFSGLTSAKGLLKRFREAVGDVQIEDLPGPRLSVAVTNLTTGRSEILDRGPLAEAMLASCALPFFFRPVKTVAGYCWDGGLANSLPVDHFTDDAGIHSVIVHHITHGGGLALPIGREPSIVQAFSSSYQVLHEQISRMAQEKLAVAGKQLFVCRTSTIVPHPIRRKTRLTCWQHGVETARKRSEQWRELVVKNESLPPVALPENIAPLRS